MTGAGYDDSASIGPVGEEILVRFGSVLVLFFDLLLDELELGQDVWIIDIAICMEGGQVA